MFRALYPEFLVVGYHILVDPNGHLLSSPSQAQAHGGEWSCLNANGSLPRPQDKNASQVRVSPVPNVHVQVGEPERPPPPHLHRRLGQQVQRRVARFHAQLALQPALVHVKVHAHWGGQRFG